MEKIGIPVKITLKTAIERDLSDKEEFELTVFGSYVHKDDTVYLIYEEFLEKGQVRTVVKYRENEGVTISRKGTVNMHLDFAKDEQKSGQYRTDVGTFLLHTNTDELDFNWSSKQNQGHLRLAYHFFMEKEHVGFYRMDFQFAKVEDKN